MSSKSSVPQAARSDSYAFMSPRRRGHLCDPVRGEDYIFLPDYKNRETASRVIARQFNKLLDHAGLKHDPITNTERSVYCLRDTAICMRLILSQGKVNIFNLVKNAETSVEQIERYYAKHLPLSKEMAKNLQSFGE